jgi:glycosyltransferase involved in cell wall biosynthesis
MPAAFSGGTSPGGGELRVSGLTGSRCLPTVPGVHVLFVHRNFPAQFGYLAGELARRNGWRCTFVSETEPGEAAGIEKIQYRLSGDGGEHGYLLTRVIEEDVRHAAAVYERLKPLRDSLRPDLIVGHSGLGPTLFLPDLFPATPLISYFEDFYKPRRSAMEFRTDWPVSEKGRLGARVVNATVLLDLEYCTAGYTPTRFQHGLLPAAYAGKVRVLHDGIDTNFWRRRENVPPRSAFSSPRIVTYVSRGLETLRGFDIFMKIAKLVYETYPDVVFFVVGGEEAAYGEMKRLPEKSFKEHVLNQDQYDLEKIQFLGILAPEVLVQILSMSDLHIYLTAPFALSWSLLNAMACGCVVLASDTAPVSEVITSGHNGILRDFFDVEGFADVAVGVLRDPQSYRDLGTAAVRTVREGYDMDVALPGMTSFYEEVAAGAHH